MKSVKSLKVDWTWEEWQASRAARKAVADRVGPPVIRRKDSSSDRRLRRVFNGERGPAFDVAAEQ